MKTIEFIIQNPTMFNFTFKQVKLGISKKVFLYCLYEEIKIDFQKVTNSFNTYYLSEEKVITAFKERYLELLELKKKEYFDRLIIN